MGSMEEEEEEEKTKKEGENLPPNYRTLAQLQEQWEKKRAQELNRHQKKLQQPEEEEEEEEPPPETALPDGGGGGGGDTCPRDKAIAEAEAGEGGVKKRKKWKKRKNEGEGKPREVKKKEKEKEKKKKEEEEKSDDVESEGEGNPRGERKGGGFRGFEGNRTVEKWVKVGIVGVGVGGSDRTKGKELEIQNVEVEIDRRVKVGSAGELSVRDDRGYNGGGDRAKRQNRRIGRGRGRRDQSLDVVKQNVGVDEGNLAVEVRNELGKLSVRDVRKNGRVEVRKELGKLSVRDVRKNGRARRGGGVGKHRDQTAKVESFENVGIEENDQTLDGENAGVEESDQTAKIRRELGELSVREDGAQEDGHRGRAGGRNRTKGQNIRAGRGRGGKGYHRDRVLKVEKVLEIENVEAERSDQKVEDVVEIKDAVGENVGVEESNRKAEVGLSIRDDEGREDGRSYRQRDHNVGGNITKWQHERLGRGRGKMSHHRDWMVKVEKELGMENLGIEESDQTVENVVEIKDVVEENLLEDVLQIKDAVNVGVESGGTTEVGNWHYERAGRGGDRTGYRRGHGGGGYSYGNDRRGNGRSNQRRGRERNGTVWVRKEDAAA